MNRARLRDNLLIASREMSQKELADKLKITVRTVNGWMSGAKIPTLYGAYRFCKLVGITVEQLMDGVEDE